MEAPSLDQLENSHVYRIDNCQGSTIYAGQIYYALYIRKFEYYDLSTNCIEHHCTIFFLNLDQLVRINYGSHYFEVFVFYRLIIDLNSPNFIPLAYERLPRGIQEYLDKHFGLKDKLSLQIMGM